LWAGVEEQARKSAKRTELIDQYREEKRVVVSLRFEEELINNLFWGTRSCRKGFFYKLIKRDDE
jgi:hypothetical protein